MFRRLYYKLIKKPNTLDIIDVGDYGDYGTRRSRYTTLEKLKKKASSWSRMLYGVTNTTYNNQYYPVYDLDTEDDLKVFKQEVKDNYVLFQSSPDHYWAILDLPLKKLKDYKSNVNWNTLCDVDYKDLSLYYRNCCLRFTYDTLDRKPFIIKHYNDTYSDNFKEFIDKFENLIEEDGLELSVLIGKDKELLNLYNTKTNRKNKFKKIIN